MSAEAVDSVRDARRGAPARTAAALVLTALSSWLVIAMWPLFGNAWWLAPVAFVPMYVAQYRLVPRRWSFAPVAVTFGSYGFAVAMLGSSIASAWIVGAGSLAMGLLGAAIGAFQRPFSERTRYRWFVVQLPIVWLFLEVVTQDNEVIGTFPWMAYRLSSAPELAAPVSITGTPALSFLLMVINAAVALVVLRMLDTLRPHLADVEVPARVAWGWGAGVLACALVWAFAGWGITAQVRRDQGPSQRVAYIQPGLGDTAPGVLFEGDPADARTADQRRDDQAVHLSELTAAAAARGAQLVVWPEEVLDYDPREVRTQWIPDLVQRTGIYLVAGFTRDFADASQPNRALLWSPSGEILGSYSKTKRVVMEGEAFEPGAEYPTFDTAVGPLGMVICYDLDFPDGPVRRVAESGARIVAAPSIDFASVADLRTDTTSFRAIENRVGIVKADLAWDSAVIGADGTVLGGTVVTSPDGGAATAVVDLPRGPGGAPFTAYGNAPITIVGVVAMLMLAWGMVGSTRRRPSAR